MFIQHRHFRRFLAVTTALSFCLPGVPAFAQDAGAPPGDAAAPPGRVGEVASLTGSVSYNGAGSNNQWVAATQNYPLTSGDSLFTQDGAQAALAVDSSRLTLAANTELQVTGLDQSNFAATESQGEMFLAINYIQPGQSYVITTPRGTVNIHENGNYAIAAGDANTPTVVTVLAGEATVTDPGATLQVQANEAGVLSGTDQTVAQLGAAQRDDFITRMLAEIAPPPPAYAPPVVQQMTGVSQLGNYGSWDQSPQYGAVWYPSVATGWAPYRQGYWSYVAPWGYTWVESEPWGFAPFHYGRWIDDNNRWGWVPAYGGGGGYGGGYGQSYAPVYAPAVVSFFGAGLAVGLTIGAFGGGGNVGWVPLAPDEPFYPYYRAPPSYVQRINVVNVRNINVVNIHNTTINNYNYAGLANRRAAYYAPATAFSRGEQISRYGRPAPKTMLAAARPVGPEGFRPAQAAPGQPAAHAPLALPPPQITHREARPPQLSQFAQRRSLPPTVLSHEPAQLAAHGGGFANAALHQPAVPQALHAPGPPAIPPHPRAPEAVPPGGPHPGFATLPGYHAPPPPPMVNGGNAGQHQPLGGQTSHPPATGHAPVPPALAAHAVNHPSAPPQFHPEATPHMPAPPVIHSPEVYHPPAAPQFHPQAPAHAPAPPVYHPQETYHPPAPQVFHPQPVYHPPAQPAFHPQAVPQFHPPSQPELHPQPVPQFHPQPAPQFHPAEPPPQDRKPAN